MLHVDATEYGRLQARHDLLLEALRRMVRCAAPCLPDLAPFDMDHNHSALAFALDHADYVLERYRPQPKPQWVSDDPHDIAEQAEREYEAHLRAMGEEI